MTGPEVTQSKAVQSKAIRPEGDEPQAARPAPELSRWNWRNWPVLVKLVAVLLIPTIVALVVGVLRVVDEASAVPRYTQISRMVGVQQQLSGLIAAIERERDLATDYVAGGRIGPPVELNRQAADVDRRVAEVRVASDDVLALASAGYRPALYQLAGLHALRESAITGNALVNELASKYGAAIDPLIAFDAGLLRQLNDVAVADDAAAVHALVSTREQISRQHAIISAALYEDDMGSVAADDVRAAAVRLGADQESFRTAVDPGERADLTVRVAGQAELARQRMMQDVLDRASEGESLKIPPAEWDARSAAAIADVSAVEDELRTRIDRTALSLRDDARANAGWNAVILLFALALGVGVGILMARAMLRPLGVLRRSALDVAARRLPEAVSRIREGEHADLAAVQPVPVRTREEIGQVARAFDEVQRQAVRLAAEQARVRENVNDIFVNLSRRSQSLVERQLQLIDRLESSEQDPDQLDNLFQLDHLATRMRRNSENLLVLAGTEGAKRASRPVRLVDVLRAAVSEVEQYQRLSLQQPPGALVLGRTASDLVHLLAELLDNAAQFSPPDTQVIVSGGFDGDGGVRIEVVDRGVGMTETELADANERLASTPVVDASVSRRMGLFVVGRLAVRHGIGVRLRRGDGGIGVCATVLMPSRLVRPVGEPAEARPALSGARGALPAGAGPGPDEPSMPGPLSTAPGPGPDAGGDVALPGVPGDFFTPQSSGSAVPYANGNGTRSPQRSGPDTRPDGSPPAVEDPRSRPDSQPPEEPGAEDRRTPEPGATGPQSLQAQPEQPPPPHRQAPPEQPGPSLPKRPDPPLPKRLGPPGQALPNRQSGPERPPGPAGDRPGLQSGPEVPQRTGDRSGPPGPPPGPSPASVPAADSGGDLFRPNTPAEPVEPTRDEVPPAGQASAAQEAPPAPQAGLARDVPQEDDTAQDRTAAQDQETGQDEGQDPASLRLSTPIFDDVATAWFRDRHGMPVRWVDTRHPRPDAAEGAGRAETGGAGSVSAAPSGDEETSARREPAQADLASGTPDRADPAPADDTPAEPEPVDRAQPQPQPETEPEPAEAEAEPAPAERTGAQAAPGPRSADRHVGYLDVEFAVGVRPDARPVDPPAEADPVVADPVVADPVVADPLVADPVVARPAGFRPAVQARPPEPATSQRPAQHWGGSDEGWRAAQALAAPPGAGVTASGLPRRQPRALLVPGAASGAEETPSAAPARDAETVRGRLSSYQQGIREGRQVRRNLTRDDGPGDSHHESQEETK